MDKYKFLIALFFLALFIRIAAVFITPIKIWDETVYASLGWDLKSNPLDYSFARKWSDYVPGDWPKAGYRAPLLPYILSGLYSLTKSQVLIDLFMPLIGATSVILLYLVSQNLFNKKIALYASLFLTFLPLHVIYSGKILTEVLATFFLILSVLFFWLGFEKGKNKYKLLFGFSIALSLLSRYTSLWVFPIFPIYLILKHRNLSFLKDKFLWYCLGIFLITLLPWFLYGLSEYNNPIGPFLHAKKAANYWGGTQPWYFFFQNSIPMFSILSIIFVLSVAFIIYDKKSRKNLPTIFLLLWFFIFLVFAMVMPHKEERFLIPATPPLAIISALFISKIKKYSKIIFFSIIILISAHLTFLFYSNIRSLYTQTNQCFLEANKFIANLEDNCLVITEQSPIVYFYTKHENHFYPQPFKLSNIQSLVNNYYRNRPVYILWSEYDMSLEDPNNKVMKNMLDSNFETIFKCPSNGSLAIVYKYR